MKMKLPQRLKIVIPVMLLAGVIVFAVWYFMEWYKPTGTIVPGAPMELMRVVQDGNQLKITKKGKEEIIPLPEGKDYQFKMDYPETVFLEQTVIVNGIRMKGTYKKENGFSTGFSETFHPGEKRKCSLMIQLDWQVEKHRFLDRYRGKCWKLNYSVR